MKTRDPGSEDDLLRTTIADFEKQIILLRLEANSRQSEQSGMAVGNDETDSGLSHTEI
jgi:hypothetical protein